MHTVHEAIRIVRNSAFEKVPSRLEHYPTTDWKNSNHNIFLTRGGENTQKVPASHEMPVLAAKVVINFLWHVF